MKKIRRQAVGGNEADAGAKEVRKHLPVVLTLTRSLVRKPLQWSGALPWVLEVSDRAAAFALEVRPPFLEKRLVEFSLAPPSERKLFHGWGRVVMRRPMYGILPEEIRWRGGKTGMNPNFIHGLLKIGRYVLDEILLCLPAQLEKLVDESKLRELHQRLLFER